MQDALDARSVQQRNLAELTTRISSQIENRGKLMGSIERNEFLLAELERYLDIRIAAFKKVINERGLSMNQEIWGQIMSTIVERKESWK